MASIITTKFLRLSVEEFLAHHTHRGQQIIKADMPRWYGPHREGDPVAVKTPPYQPSRYEVIHAVCDGPFYQVADDSDAFVCPHIAEIGD